MCIYPLEAYIFRFAVRLISYRIKTQDFSRKSLPRERGASAPVVSPTEREALKILRAEGPVQNRCYEAAP